MPAKAPRRLLNSYGPAEPGDELAGARSLPLAVVEANAAQSRQTFNEGAMAELAQSIQEHGVQQPILVRPHPEQPGRYQVVAGERRTRAARMAGLEAIPAIIREMTDEEAAFATAIENLQREDLDLEDEARWFAYLQDLTGLSGRSLASKLGKTHVYVNRRLALLDRPDLLQAIRTGELTQRDALARLTRDPDAGDVEHGVPLRSEDSEPGAVEHGVPTTERAALDARPTTFRWRPWQQFATVVAKTRPQDVPADERATFRAQIAGLREQLEALEAALEAEG